MLSLMPTCMIMKPAGKKIIQNLHLPRDQRYGSELPSVELGTHPSLHPTSPPRRKRKICQRWKRDMARGENWNDFPLMMKRTGLMEGDHVASASRSATSLKNLTS